MEIRSTRPIYPKQDAEPRVRSIAYFVSKPSNLIEIKPRYALPHPAVGWLPISPQVSSMPLDHYLPATYTRVFRLTRIRLDGKEECGLETNKLEGFLRQRLLICVL